MSGSCQDITEHKWAEKALCESEERYRMLVDLSPNGVFVYCNGKKVYVNQAACTILGAASPEQLFEVSTFHFSHPDDYESIHISLAQILATGEPVRRVEWKYQRLDGTPISVEVDAARNSGMANPPFKSSSPTSPTASRRTWPFVQAKNGIGRCTMTRRLCTSHSQRTARCVVNRFGAEQLGYRVEELIGHSVLGLFHEQDKEAVAGASLSECLATPDDHEILGVSEGRERWEHHLGEGNGPCGSFFYRGDRRIDHMRRYHRAQAGGGSVPSE